jgi:transcriptional regulator with XRE-family HTH domain
VTNSVQEARESLGLRLREIRRDAGITQRRLSELAGWHESKTSRIEYGKQTPSDADLAAWCAHTGTSDQLPDLIATLRNIHAAYMEWRRVLGTGMRHRQQVSVRLEGNATALRWYEPMVFPGLLQTPEYAEGILRRCIDFYGVPDDIEAAVAARIERQRVLYQGRRRFHFVIAEQALHTTVGDDEVMAGQLDRALTLMGLPRIAFGIVPLAASYEAPAVHGFSMFDDQRVLVETISAELTITQPRELAIFEKMFALLTEQAVYGDAARNLVTTALATRQERLR